MKRSAILSECGAYRLQLYRGLDRSEWNTTIAGGYVSWVLLNPSKADAEIDDPTVKRCWTFTRAWGYGNMLMVNTNPHRATDPKLARMPPENVLTANDSWLTYVMGQSRLTVCGWGDKGNPELVRRACKVMHEIGPLYALRVTKAGNPQHPLYLPGSLEPQLWKPTTCLH